MPVSKSNLVSLHEDIINHPSDLSEMKISDENGSVEKRTMTLIEKNGYQDSVYINAAKIFQGIHTEKPKDTTLVRYGDDSVSPMPTFKDEYSQRASYELAFSALKYQDLLEEILLDSCVYPCQSIPDELTSLLVVMLYDLQDRKFQAREIFEEEKPVAEVREIEHYLYSFRTKLAAALARCRIKHDAPSIEYFLPETIWKQEQRASALPLCVWINTFKISLEDVFGDLKKKGFTRVESVSDFDRYMYCIDQHCHDVLFFPSSLKEELLNLDLLADGKLLLQDKSRSLAVHAAQALLNTDDDIILAHIGSHLTTAHLSALTVHSTSTIFVCGVKSSAKADELRNLFTHMGCKNIKLLHEAFTEIEPTDPRLKKARVILLLPQCSGLGVGNPIDFILNEHRDAGLLRDLFQGSVSEDKLCILAERQLNELMHAMKFKVQAIVYCTCSIYPEENELVVKKALESGEEGNNVQRYRLIPPVFSTCSDSIASTENFFKMEPSEISSGCFVAILEREKHSSDSLSVKDVLAHAAAKGLLDGVVEKSKDKKKKQKVTQRRRNITGRRTKPRTAELLHHHTISSIKGEVSMSKGVSSIRRSNITGSCTEPRPAELLQRHTVSSTKGEVSVSKGVSNIRRGNITGSRTEPRTAELLHHHTISSTKGEVSMSKGVSNIHRRNITGSSTEPRTAELLQHHTVSSTKGEVSVSKRVGNIRRSNITGRRTEPRPAELLHRHTVSSTKGEVSVSKGVSNVHRCNITASHTEPRTAEVLHCHTVSSTKGEVSASKGVSNIRRRNITGRRTEPRTAELLQRHTVSSTKGEVSKGVGNIQQKNVIRTSSYAQQKKSVSVVSDKALPKVLKPTSHLSPTGKAFERQTFARKARTERKRVVLKTVEIVFPPVVTPRVSSQGSKPRRLTHHCWHGWTKAKGLTGRVLLPPLAKAIKLTVLGRPQP